MLHVPSSPCPGKPDGSIDRGELMSLLRAWGDFMKQKEVVGVLVFFQQGR